MNIALMRDRRISVSALFLAAFMLFGVSSAFAQTAFTQSMDIGSRGSQVSALQTFLSTRTSHYPEGLVTGYFGPLTQAAVQRFQCAEEIVCSGSPATTGYGRVGPKTLLQLNLVAGGGATGGVDFSAPWIGGVTAATSSNSATLGFWTSEPASAKVYFASSPITFTEAAGFGFAPIVTGTGVMTDTTLRTNHSIAISGLASSTAYYYVVQATDASGNVNFTWPTWFRTNP